MGKVTISIVKGDVITIDVPEATIVVYGKLQALSYDGDNLEVESSLGNFKVTGLKSDCLVVHSDLDMEVRGEQFGDVCYVEDGEVIVAKIVSEKEIDKW